MKLFNGNNIPKKPKLQKDQIEQLWDAAFNHLPTRIRWIDTKLNFVLVFLGILMALIALMLVK